MSYETDICRCGHPRVAHFEAGNCVRCECGNFYSFHQLPPIERLREPFWNKVMRCDFVGEIAQPTGIRDAFKVLTVGKNYHGRLTEVNEGGKPRTGFQTVGDDGEAHVFDLRRFVELPQTGVEKMPAPVPEAPIQGAQSNANGAGFALPTDPKARKDIPMVRGLLDYFPAALAAVAELSRIGNEQHNPGQEMHHARGKSTDHADCIVRHLMDRDTVDTDGVRHATKVAWRALALLQLELEAAGAKKARAAK